MSERSGTNLAVLPRGQRPEEGGEVLVLKPEQRVAPSAAPGPGAHGPGTHGPGAHGVGAVVTPLFDEPREAEPPTALDEAALRAFVAHLVRDELRSSFGERLTRQIRALVRREVSRLMLGRTAD